MRVVNWSEVKPFTVKAGEKAELNVVLHADRDKDINVLYIVALGVDDLRDITEGNDVVPTIFSKAVTEAGSLREAAEKLADVENIVAAQAQRIADLETQLNSVSPSKSK